MRARAFSSGDSRQELAAAAAAAGVSWSDETVAFGGNVSDKENRKASRGVAGTSATSSSISAELTATADLYTTEIVRAIFGPMIGAVVGDYFCTHKRTNGRMYIATNAICYYSNLFSSESKYVFRFADMVEVTKVKSNGICIATKTTNGTDAKQQHNFRSFRDRDAVYQIICRLHSESTDATSAGVVGVSNTSRPPPGRAATFDASSLGLLFPDAQEGGAAGAVAATSSSSSRRLTKSFSSISESSSFNKWPKKPKVSRKGRKKHRRIRSQSMDSFDLRGRADTGESGSTIDNGSDVDSSDDEGQSVGGDDACFHTEGGELAEDPAQDWSKLKEQRLKETVLDEIHLACSLVEFYENFVADDCVHSFGSFQTSIIGDFELEVEKWEQDNSAAANSRKRTITFRHPLKHKLGPKDASMKKHQHLHYIPYHGIVLKSCTYGKGFPAADAFHVEDMWIIEPYNANAGKSGGQAGGVTMSVLFQIHYSKSTMFRKMIDASTKQEYTQMYNKYMEMAASALGGEEKTKTSDVLSVKTVEEKPKLVKEAPPAEAPMLRIVALLAITVLGIFALAYYVSKLRSRVASLEEQMEEMRQSMIILQSSVAAANDMNSPETPLLTLL
mmetsp:Transcript_26517/g.76547  ORF Transcript_26517/g.76547 Transcript_26517/m.76547 type:complete len:616 (-) Transcript_26517:1544-3391(-)